MAKADFKIEIELRIYWVKENKNWRWWKFWEPKEIRTLSEKDSVEAEIAKVIPEELNQ